MANAMGSNPDDPAAARYLCGARLRPLGGRRQGGLMQNFIDVRVESEVGLARDHNEDLVWVGPGLMVVADGMGGHEAGEVASRLAVEVIAANAERLRAAAADKAELLQQVDEVFQEASATIEREARGNGMGTTLVCAILAPDDTTVYVAHVGDSRAYVLREGVLVPITSDHNVRNLLLARGRSQQRAEAHPASAKLTQAMGMGMVQPDVAEVRLAPDDRLLLCSDGLTDVVDDATIGALLERDDDAAQALVDAVYDAGAPDNVSLVVASVPSPRSSMFVRDDHAHLKALELFRGLDGIQLAAVAPFLTERRFAAGTCIAAEGDDGSECLVLTRGVAEITSGGAYLNTIHAGNAVGELALTGPWSRSATITAVEDVHAYVLTREAYEELGRVRPRIGLAIANVLARTAAEQLRRVTVRMNVVVRAASGEFDDLT